MSSLLQTMEIERLTSANEALQARNAELEATIEKLDAIGADAYDQACEQMEKFQRERRAAGLEVGTTRSLVDGMSWVYGRLAELEARVRGLAEANERSLKRELALISGQPCEVNENGAQLLPTHLHNSLVVRAKETLAEWEVSGIDYDKLCRVHAAIITASASEMKEKGNG